MHLPEILFRRPALTLAAAFAFGLLFAAGDAPAQPPAPAALDGPDAVIVIYPTHWRWAGASYDELDTLAAVVLPRTPRSVGLYACGDGTARLHKAAAHRFRYLELELRVLDPGSAPCKAQDGPRNPALVPGVDEVAVERWWSGLMP